MKTLKILICLFVLGCSQSDDPEMMVNQDMEEEQQQEEQQEEEDEEAPPAFSIDLTISQDSPVIDEIVELTAVSSEDISSISFSLDNGVTFGTELTATFGNTASLYFDFSTPGSKNITFRVKNNEGAIVDTSTSVQVSQGNAVRITGITLHSFYNMGTPWDDEFDDDDPNRLADLVFVLLKPSLNHFDGVRSAIVTDSWIRYRSEVRDNENNLNWLIEDEEIFVNPDLLEMYISFADDDGGNTGQDVMQGPPSYRLIPITDYIDTQPSIFTVQENDIDLEYEVMINW